ncbi:hypothetical protein HW555_013938 [Spodoptera exigua]|uniref:Enoyl reductase (ER) domain-containing protein n=1 Tax=Spodoptera exigua TaxID=7107 RepID=A0A835G4P5_SPOEX|nr:hypothetical protein HW555_013938 [Spodoptera exigua]
MPVSTETAFLSHTDWNHVKKRDCFADEKVCETKGEVGIDPVPQQRSMKLHTLQFVPHFQVNQQVSASLRVFLQIVAENTNKSSIKVVGINNSHINSSVFDEMKKIGSYVYGIKVDYEELNESDLNSSIKGIGTFLKNADLAIVRNLSTNENMCQLLHFTIQRNSFIVSEEDNLFGGRTRPKSLYHTVCAHSNAHSRLDLVRWRPTMELMPTTAITVPQDLDLSLLSAARQNLPSKHRLLIVCPYPAPQNLKSHVQKWRKDVERNHVYLLTVNKEEGTSFFIDDLPDINLAFTVFDHGNWGGQYYIPVRTNANLRTQLTLQSTQVGDASSLDWVDSTESCGTGIPVTVHYAGLTSSDYKKAIGLKSVNHTVENSYGIRDFSGVTESGERVMGLVAHGAASSVVHARPELLWPVPSHWTLEDAATVPLAYAHALYCLGIKKPANLTPETTVFVHRGDGTFGQAVISIALGHGCQVYTTVSHRRNKFFLLKLFPTLQADHIGNLKDRNFINTVLNDTKGNGCDIVLSCVKGDMKKTSILCCGMDEICLEFSQLHNTNEDNACGLFNLKKTRSYSAIDFARMLANDNTVERKMLQQMLSEGISKGYVRPLTRMSYALHEVSHAFQLLSGRQRSRLLLKMHEPTNQTPVRISCNPNQSQLIILSEERIGLELVERLVARGARKLHIHTNNNTSAKFQSKLRMLEKLGVEVQTSSVKLEQESDLVLLLNDAISMGPVQAIYVVTNDDDMLEERVLIHLDAVSRLFCRNLRNFVLINMGKTVYGKETCLIRHQNKLPAKVICLPHLNNEITVNEAVNALEGVLCSDHTVIVAQTEELLRDQPEKFAKSADIPLTESKPTTLQEVKIRGRIGMHNDVKGQAKYFRTRTQRNYKNRQICQEWSAVIARLKKNVTPV